VANNLPKSKDDFVHRCYAFSYINFYKFESIVYNFATLISYRYESTQRAIITYSRLLR